MYLFMDVLINQPRNAGSSTSLTASIALGIKILSSHPQLSIIIRFGVCMLLFSHWPSSPTLTTDLAYNWGSFSVSFTSALSDHRWSIESWWHCCFQVTRLQGVRIWFSLLTIHGLESCHLYEMAFSDLSTPYKSSIWFAFISLAFACCLQSFDLHRASISFRNLYGSVDP